MLVASFASSSRLKPEIRLAQAVSEFEATLSGKQKDKFQTIRSQARESPPDISDVMRLTAEFDRAASRKGRRCFGPRLTNVLQAVQQFASLGDIIIGGSQNLIACGVWSLVRTTLLAISQSGSYLEKLSTLFMNVGRSAPRYQAMALLYSRSKKLQGYLYEYFIAIVHLCQETADHAKKSVLAQMSSNFNDSEVKKIQSELELWAKSIKEEVMLLNSQTIEEEAKESSRFRELVLKSADSASYRRKMDLRLRWLDCLSAYDYITTWKQARKRGSPTWFVQDENYQAWRRCTYSQVIFLRGGLGSGKTIIMASIVDDLALKARKGSLAYFFCRHDISESLKARTIFGCLARQLMQPSAITDKLIESLGDSLLDLNINDVLQVLEDALVGTSKESTIIYWVVLDGLDECEVDEREELIRMLKYLQRKVNLLVCISCRTGINEESMIYDYPNAPWFGNFEPWLGNFKAWFIDIPDNNPDIGDFIEAELEARLESGKLSIGDAAIILEIQEALQIGAQGMFLWVALQMDNISDEKTDDAIRSALKDLPRDLSETFRRILMKAGQTCGTLYQNKILKYITAACRPLTVEELREVLSVEIGVTTWNAAKMINNIYATLACCGSLIIIDEEELTVRFTHHSIVQFLTGDIGDVPKYQFRVDDANNEMGNIIVTYLNYGVFDTQVSRTVVPKIPAQETPSKIVDSVLGQNKGVKQLALGLLRSRKQAGYDIGKILSEASQAHQESGTEFYLLPYAKEYWYNHTEDFWEKNNMAMLSLWCQLLTSSHVLVTRELNDQIERRVEQFAYYPTYPRGKSRFRRAIRIVMLANRVEALNLVLFKEAGSILIERDGSSWRREELFREIVLAVLFEIKAAKQLERYGEALEVVQFVRASLPWQRIERTRLARPSRLPSRRPTFEVPRPRNRTGPDY